MGTDLQQTHVERKLGHKNKMFMYETHSLPEDTMMPLHQLHYSAKYSYREHFNFVYNDKATQRFPDEFGKKYLFYMWINGTYI
jgi:hypothetical protein